MSRALEGMSGNGARGGWMFIGQEHAGPSAVRFEPPDVARFTIVGDVSEADARRMLGELNIQLAGKNYVLMLADMSRAGSFSPGARKLGAQRKEYVVRGVVIFGAAARLRILAKVVITAANLLSQNPDCPVYFCATEGEAREWLDDRRTKLGPDERLVS
jgi:hypothetical protein